VTTYRLLRTLKNLTLRPPTLDAFVRIMDEAVTKSEITRDDYAYLSRLLVRRIKKETPVN